MNPSALPPPSSFVEHLAFWIVVLWTGGTMAVYFLSIFNIPVLTSFSAHRIVQLRDPKFDLRPTLPNFAALHYFCAIVYGVLYPAFYFFAARTRHEMGIWYLGAHTNTWWTIAIGAVSIGWLLSNVIESILRWDRLRFYPTWPSRIIAGLALALALRFHWMTTMAVALGPARPVQPGGPPLYFQLFHPQTCFLAATLVYFFAFLETLRPSAAARPTRKRILGGALGAAAAIVLFAPFWLSVPRVTHGQAMKLLNDHRGLIAEVSAEARIDPKLLAGVIYVAHTRDHPRFTGDLIERLAIRIREHSFLPTFGPNDSPLLNPSFGIAQVRLPTMVQTMTSLEWYFGVGEDQPGSQLSPQDWQIRSEMWTLPYPDISFFIVASPLTHVGTLSSVPSVAAAQQRVPLFDARFLDRLRRRFRGQELTQAAIESEPSLLIGAAMVGLLQHQWREAGFPIDDKPEITATLYNLGYERSYPHGAPKANDFGRRALRFMNSPEAKALFPDAAAQPASESDAGKSDAR